MFFFVCFFMFTQEFPVKVVTHRKGTGKWMENQRSENYID
jgi:hypothetical protein